MHTSLIAEGHVSPGMDTDTPVTDIADLSKKQLYIKGSLISYNTIGGANAEPLICPYGVSVCDGTSATRFDLNYMRMYTAGDATNRAYRDATLD